MTRRNASLSSLMVKRRDSKRKRASLKAMAKPARWKRRESACLKRSSKHYRISFRVVVFQLFVILGENNLISDSLGAMNSSKASLVKENRMAGLQMPLGVKTVNLITQYYCDLSLEQQCTRYPPAQ